MTLTQFRYIVAIADAGLNISLAANRIHSSQPALSKQVKTFESELGFPVFVRQGKSLASITEAGKQVIAHGREILTHADQVHTLAANWRDDASGAITLVTTHTQARFVLPTYISAFRVHHPQVSLHLRPHSDAKVQSLFMDGEADMAIISSSGPAPLGGLALPLYRWRRTVVVPREHPMAKLHRPLALSDLVSQPLVAYESSLKAQSSLQKTFADKGLRPQFACTSSDADLIKTYVRAGLGVGILAEMAIQEADKDSLTILDAAALFPDCITWLVLRDNRLLRRYEFDFITEFLPQLTRNQLQQAVSGLTKPAWPEPALWQTVRAQA